MSEREEPPHDDAIAEFYYLVGRLIGLRVHLGYDIDMKIHQGRYRLQITETKAPPEDRNRG